MKSDLPQADACGGYGSTPCYPELAAVILAGAFHVGMELAVSEAAASFFNGVIVLTGIGYILWRIRENNHVSRLWGIRRDNFRAALSVQLAFGAVGALILFGIGFLKGSVTVPDTFWLTLVLYPLWGVVQQFALQNLIARNLAPLLSGPVRLAACASVLFAAAHYPRLELMGLSFTAGFFFILIYCRFPNLWAVGIAHGILGSLAAYLVFEEDPGAVVLNLLPW